MVETFEIRAATNSDSEAIRNVVFAVLREHGLTPDPEATDRDLYELESAYLHSGGSFDVLVDGRGVVVGTVGLVSLGAGRCELRKMYLAPAHRGKGHGKRLLQRAVERARKLGFHRVELETISILQTAIRLYESFGFRPFVPDHRSAGPDRVDRAYFLELDGPNPSTLVG